MNLSLCLIGNSHIAAIKQAWTSQKPAVADGVSVTFFSAAVRLLRKLERQGDVLVANNEELFEKIKFTSDGLETIELARYDAFILFGMGFCYDIANCCHGIDMVTESRSTPEGALLSRPAFAAVLEACFEDSYAVTLIDTIKSVADKPVLLCGAPYLSERVLHEEEDFIAQKRYRDIEFLNSAELLAKKAGFAVAARHRCELLWQAQSTIAAPGFTKAEFGINPVRFQMKTSGAPSTDRRHGNEAYGLIMLNAALERMNTMTGGRVLVREPTA